MAPSNWPAKRKPDILLIDFALSQRFELKALIESGSQLPPVRVVVTVTAIDKAHLVEAFRLGAHGVVSETIDAPTCCSRAFEA